MIGSVIRFDSTTTTLGGFTRSGVAVAVQPDTASTTATIMHDEARTTTSFPATLVVE
jgi:hypothetical protein